MHIQLGAWTAVCAIAPTASAFYVFNSQHDEGTGNVRRTPAPSTSQEWAGKTAGETKRGFSYATQPNWAEDGSATSRRARSPQSITMPLRRVPTLSRRDNIYPIINSKTPTRENSIAVDQDGTDFTYMVAVSFGGSDEEYHLILDSASSDSWIMGENCTTKACSMHNLLGKGKSDSLEIDSTPFSMGYGTGSVTGTLASDTMNIGSFSPSMRFGLATNTSSHFESFPFDGLLGVGLPANRHDTTHLMTALVEGNFISNKLYGVHFSRHDDGTEDGEMNFGAPNPDRYDGELNTVKTIPNDDGFWEIPLDDVIVDDKTMGLSNKVAIVDTGTSFIHAPEADATALHNLLGEHKRTGNTFYVPCDASKALQFKFGGQAYHISAADWIGDKVDTGLCKSYIFARDSFGSDTWLVGDVFLKNVYSVYDYDNEQIGLGVRAHNVNESGNEDASPTGSALALAPTTTSAGGASNGTSGNVSSKSGDTSSGPTSTSTPGGQDGAQQGGVGRAAASPVAFVVALVWLSLLM